MINKKLMATFAIAVVATLMTPKMVDFLVSDAMDSATFWAFMTAFWCALISVQGYLIWEQVKRQGNK